MRIFAFLAGLTGLAFLASQGLILGIQLYFTAYANLLPVAYLVATIAQLSFALFTVIFLLVFAGSRRAA